MVRRSGMRNSLNYLTLVATRRSQHHAELAESDPPVALATKISPRRAWAACKLVTNVASRKSSAEDKKAAVDSDSDDDMDPIARRAALGEFRKRHRYSAPMRHQPADKMFPEWRVTTRSALQCYNLKDVVCILDQDLAIRSNPSVRTRTSAQDKVVMAQWPTLKFKLKKPLRRNQRKRCRSSFLSFLTSVLLHMLEPEHEDALVRLLVSNHERSGWESLVV